MIQSSIPDKDLVLENKAPSKMEGVRGRRLHHLSGFSCEVRTSQEVKDKLMQSLRANLRETAQELGAEIDEEGEGKGEGGYFKFEIQYTEDPAHGVIKVSVQPSHGDSSKPGAKNFRLNANIEEWVR
jgi:hypothetical protein